ncbi:protein furry homolog-like protein, partial [Lates japonicus]
WLENCRKTFGDKDSNQRPNTHAQQMENLARLCSAATPIYICISASALIDHATQLNSTHPLLLITQGSIPL